MLPYPQPPPWRRSLSLSLLESCYRLEATKMMFRICGFTAHGSIFRQEVGQEWGENSGATRKCASSQLQFYHNEHVTCGSAAINLLPSTDFSPLLGLDCSCAMLGASPLCRCMPGTRVWNAKWQVLVARFQRHGM
jgi:hypothetical protein